MASLAGKKWDTERRLAGGKARAEYAMSHISKLHPSQNKLIELTIPHSEAIMLASAESILMLTNMLKFAGAKRCIDVGVFTGYSSLSWALSIPDDGKVVACDISSEYPEIGKPVWKEAGVDHKIDLRIGKAAETLQAMVDAGESGTYDFMFIDADKVGYDDYYEFGLKLLRPQGIIAVDNAMWGGQVADTNDNSDSTVAIRNLNSKIKSDTRVSAVMVDISDGINVCLKN